MKLFSFISKILRSKSASSEVVSEPFLGREEIVPDGAIHMIELPENTVVSPNGYVHYFLENNNDFVSHIFIMVEHQNLDNLLNIMEDDCIFYQINKLDVIAVVQHEILPQFVNDFIKEKFLCDVIYHTVPPAGYNGPVRSIQSLKPSRTSIIPDLDLSGIPVRFQKDMKKKHAAKAKAGEINWRSRYDKDWRGIILPPTERPDWMDKDSRMKIIKGGSDELYQDSDQELALLKAYLVYWDRMVGPFTQEMHRGHRDSPARVTLKQWGVLEDETVGPGIGQPDVTTTDPDGEQLTVFDLREKQDPGRWAIATDRLDFERLVKNEGRCLVTKLHDALPVPNGRTPFDDILEFHLKRRAECLALRYHIDEMYQKILTCGDTTLEIQKSLSVIANATSDQITVMEESGLKFHFAGLEARIKWEIDPTSVTTSAVVAALATGSFTVGALAGASSNLIPKVEISSGVETLGDKGANPWGYALHVRAEL